MDENTTITVEMYGGLKDFFSPLVNINASEISSIADVITELIRINPQATDLINNCLVGVNGTICKKNIDIKPIDKLVLLPPFSGG